MMPDAPAELPYEGAKEMLLVEQVEDRAFLRALLRCTPADWVRYVRLSAVVPRTAARVRAGFLRRPAKP